jgi:hypothetical protein
MFFCVDTEWHVNITWQNVYVVGLGGTTEIPTGKAVLQNAYEEQPIDTMRVVQAR